MKRFFLLFLLCSWLYVANASGKFYIASTSNATLENIVGNKLTSNVLTNKQTYDCHENNVYSIVNTNNDTILAFSSDVIVKLNENSKLNIDSFEQTIENINDLPDIAKYNTINLNLTLFGSAQFVVKSTFTESNPMIISTSLANIVVKSGKFIIRSEDKSLLIVMLEGEATVLDTLSKHKQTIKDKNMLVVVPAPKLQGRAAEHAKAQNMVSVKTLDDVEYKDLNSDLTTLSEHQNNIKFIVINKDVVGVKIR